MKCRYLNSRNKQNVLLLACMPVFDECAEGCPYKVQV